MKFVYKDFPLEFHNLAQKAAEAAECAHEHGKFWEYHDILFERQAEWSAGGVQKFKDYARYLGLETDKFDECLDPGKYEIEERKTFKTAKWLESVEHRPFS